MEQEYLFEGKKYREQVEQYVPKDCRVNCEIEELEGSECWVAKFSILGNGEEEASVLSDLHQDIYEKYNPIVLHNGAAEYFTGELYPYYSTYERRLRKFLYLKSAICTDQEVGQQIKDLEEKDLSQMFQLLFTDSGFTKKARNTLKNSGMGITKDELLRKIQACEEKTVWESLVGSDALPVFQENFDFLKEVRNDVMHAHNLDTEIFREARDLLEEVNRQLDEAIGKIAMRSVQTNRQKEQLREQSAEGLDEEKHRKFRRLAPLLGAGLAAPVLLNTMLGLGLLVPTLAPAVATAGLTAILCGKDDEDEDEDGEGEAVPES